MASITIRNLDDQIKERLRIEAALNGHSMEEEARLILRRALRKPAQNQGLASRIRARFAETGGIELELPTREERVRTVGFDE
ncbi:MULTISPECIES: plasmid stabilization protein [Pseudomonas]|jgi:plasmid stability protein|uniref:FitA-like ribbon-helix-helix domain-containing protein n=1 Tax=Pseudomonas TaxID=286 RepID=UPI001295465D|nr:MULTISPECIES: plasmid stabilization protein [Pseudomonas]MDU7557674.1 plasmid stabilization protein [Pseudomonas sp.]MCU1756829.1 plasmid stabilization protein [Pseudomonas helleri]MQT41920.1 plasmid stabilization protein [Pseudomonas sp. FSL R10-0765]MQT52605.1 plasmid stabilization protein [Pseudomonas sp. FSL R10-2398]MQT98999.1 plasmid stabilization protein [Pseudomonas sp. FSL R10-2245]